MITRRIHERGQVVVIIALALVGLFGFAGLAIDGGLLYAHRRHAQNSADAAALAGALAKAQGYSIETAVLNRTKSNGFDNDDPTIIVEINYPPTIEPFQSDKDKNQYIQVNITSEMDSVFAHLVFNGPLRNTVVAISRARPPMNINDGYAISGTSTYECSTILFAGNGTLKLQGGDIFSNSDGSEKSGGCPAAERIGSGNVVLTDQDLRVVGYYENNGGGGELQTGTGHIITGEPQQQLPKIPEPPCPDLASNPVQSNLIINSDQVLSPGNYTNIKALAGANVTLNPGTYCIDGKFEAMGGSITGSDVLIKMLSGEFNLGGNTNVDLSAHTSGDWAWLLIYGNPTTTTVKITGNTGSLYTGTIYAPESQCIIQGNSETISVSSQMICRTVKITGNGDIDINYDREYNYKLPNTIELAK